ncbi:MAG: hypothetical protein IRZ16_15330 [Myxococcaceae bacterium]|nr:hypothetical protein [Myxococcaceae bacterium]
MKEVYILATRAMEPVAPSALLESLDEDEVTFSVAEGEEWAVALEADGARVEIRFEALTEPLGWAPDFLTRNEPAQKLLSEARGFYRIAFEPGKPEGSVAVFVALRSALLLFEHVEGVLLDVTSYKLHEPEDVQEITDLEFDIRDHVNLHAVAVEEGETPLWVHSHGMEKFGQRDVEVFQLSEDDLAAAESFLHQLCTDLAFGEAPPLRVPLDVGDEGALMLVPSEEARASLMGVPLEAFEGHEGQYLTVLSGNGRHNVSSLLAPYREQFAEEPRELTEALQQLVTELLPAFKARFLRRGLMEPLSFRVRASFESHPEGEPPVNEDLWLEVIAWDHDTLVGRLIDGGAHTTEWRKGSHVRIDEASINALALAHEGRPLELGEIRELLKAERPA